MLLSSTSLVMASTALVGAALASDAARATLPIGITFVGIMLTILPASLFMGRFGRRAGFLIGATAGICGGLLAAGSIHATSFTGFCVASALFGIANGFGHFYRFAAAELVAPSQRARAISWVLAGGWWPPLSVPMSPDSPGTSFRVPHLPPRMP